MDEASVAAAYLSAAQEALRAFPIEPAQVSFVALSENVTFRVTDARDHADYVLRLHRPTYHTLEELEAERVWIRALADAGIAVPLPLTTRAGREYTTVAIGSTGEHRHAGLARWTAGDVLADRLRHSENVGLIEGYFVQLGAIMAAMHNQACAWRVPAAFKRHNLNADGLMGDAPFWGRFWEHPDLSSAERDLLRYTRDRIRAALLRYGQRPDSFSLIHADMHPANLVVHDDTLTVIDFDDAGFGWHPYDIAVALLPYRAKPHYASVEAALLRGYRSHRAMSAEALALVPMFMLIRNMAQIGWMMQRPELGRSISVEHKESVYTRCVAFEPAC